MGCSHLCLHISTLPPAKDAVHLSGCRHVKSCAVQSPLRLFRLSRVSYAHFVDLILQASDDELLMCHSEDHIKRVDGLYMNPRRISDGQLAEREGDTYIISGDIFCNRHTSTAARSAAGCAAQVTWCFFTARLGCSGVLSSP